VAEPTTLTPEPTPDAPRPERVFTPLHVFFVIFVATAGCLFFYKLYAFLSTIKRDELAGFAFDPIIVYAFVALGFLMLLLWAWMTGQFRDIERPKHDMLRRFEEQERAEGRCLDWGIEKEDTEAPHSGEEGAR
jgi:nitrogen fixation-related uncharacterized protein